MESKVKVSVCVSTYNQEDTIKQCIISILHQVTDYTFEVIVGDDCSSDKTASILKELALEYPGRLKLLLSETNKGPSENYLAIHQSAKGEYICHLDGDDFALPNKLQKCSTFLDHNPNIGVLFHRMELLYFDGSIKEDCSDPKKMGQSIFSQKDILALGSIGAHSSRMYRSKLRLEAYPEIFLDYYVDVMQTESFNAYILNDILGGYRVGVGVSSASDNTKKLYINHLKFFFDTMKDKRKYILVNILTQLLIKLKKRQIDYNLFRACCYKEIFLSCFLFFKYLKFRFYFRLP